VLPGEQRSFSFPKRARLLERAEFLAVKERGRGFVDGPLAASWLSRPDGSDEMNPAMPRVGLTVSSKVGNAVVRNRIKRKLREAVRHELAALPAVDLVIVARASSKDATVADLRRWMRRAAARIRGDRR
jgi:ribonuclease P protein component